LSRPLEGIDRAPIAESGASYEKAYASDIRRGKWTPHVSTWVALAKLVGIGADEFVTEGVDTSTVEPTMSRC
jgi:hypothetical protein